MLNAETCRPERRPNYLPDWATDDIRRALADARRHHANGPWERALELELRRRVAVGVAPTDALVRAGLDIPEEDRDAEGS